MKNVYTAISGYRFLAKKKKNQVIDHSCLVDMCDSLRKPMRCKYIAESNVSCVAPFKDLVASGLSL